MKQGETSGQTVDIPLHSPSEPEKHSENTLVCGNRRTVGSPWCYTVQVVGAQCRPDCLRGGSHLSAVTLWRGINQWCGVALRVVDDRD